MKILAIGDPHGKLPKNLNSIIKKNKIEIIICLGDIAAAPLVLKKGETFNQGMKRLKKGFKEIVDKLCSYKLPVLTLRGNVYINSKENNEVTKKIFSPHKNLFHKKIGKIRIKGKNFIFFDIVYEPHSMRGTSKNKLIKPSQKIRLNKLLREVKDPLLISHVPPYGCLDKLHSGKHVGSKILLRAIKKYKPKLVLCGHIHEDKGKAKIGRTKIYNLGCCGDYKIITLINA